jgi:hypothetical protein
MNNYSKNLILFLVFISLSCEEKLPPEDFASDISVIPIGKVTYNSADFYWSEYDGPDFDRYEIYYKSIYDKDYQLYQAIKLVKLTFTTIYNLKPKTIYYFYVKAIDKSGNNRETIPRQIETLSDEPSPVILYNINPKYVSYYSARIAWSGYSDSLVIDFSHYELYYSPVTPYFVPSKENLSSQKRLCENVLDMPCFCDYI